MQIKPWSRAAALALTLTTSTAAFAAGIVLVDGSSTQTLPTCPKTEEVSIARNAASSPVSCCTVTSRWGLGSGH